MCALYHLWLFANMKRWQSCCFSYQLLLFLSVIAFLISCCFSYQLLIFLSVVAFLISCCFSYQLLLFLSVGAFLISWCFSYQLLLFLSVVAFLISCYFSYQLLNVHYYYHYYCFPLRNQRRALMIVSKYRIDKWRRHTESDE